MTYQAPTTTLQGFIEGDPDGQHLGAEGSGVEGSDGGVNTRIAAARAVAGRTQEEVANQVGVKLSTFRTWESGSASPRSNRLAGLAGILGVSVSWLLVGAGQAPVRRVGQRRSV